MITFARIVGRTCVVARRILNYQVSDLTNDAHKHMTNEANNQAASSNIDFQTVRKYVERAPKAKNHLYKGVIAVFVVLGGLLVASAGTGFGQVNDQKQYEDQVSDLKQKLTAILTKSVQGNLTQFQKEALQKQANQLEAQSAPPTNVSGWSCVIDDVKNIDTQIWNEYRLFQEWWGGSNYGTIATCHSGNISYTLGFASSQDDDALLSVSKGDRIVFSGKIVQGAGNPAFLFVFATLGANK